MDTDGCRVTPSGAYRFSSYLVELGLGDVRPLASLSERTESVLNLFTWAHVLCLAADHERHVLAHGHHAVTE